MLARAGVHRRTWARTGAVKCICRTKAGAQDSENADLTEEGASLLARVLPHHLRRPDDVPPHLRFDLLAAGAVGEAEGDDVER